MTLLLLIVAETLLSLDNVLVICALANKHSRPKLLIGLGIVLSAILRIGLLIVTGLALHYIVGVLPYLLVAGGLLLIYTGLSNKDNNSSLTYKVIALDIIFSIDSVLAGLAFTSDLSIIALAIILTTIPMYLMTSLAQPILSKINVKYLIVGLGIFMLLKALT